MEIDERHAGEPGLVVLEISAADEETLREVMDGLQQRWATSGVTPVWRTPGEPGVHTRAHADIRAATPRSSRRAPPGGEQQPRRFTVWGACEARVGWGLSGRPHTAAPCDTLRRISADGNRHCEVVQLG
ncbi:DUF6207 family protein [Streptomyces sp. NPDC058434]|uniref:DUF6207 family protein n=1 Tax=Streptomyces sp. NPDC058434 TaxID=3346498 RepID=UPI0036670FE3